VTASSGSDVERPWADDRATLVAGDPGALSAEVNYLHRLWFGRNPSTEFINAYLAAHSELAQLRDAPGAQYHTVRCIVQRRLDALCVELWLRTSAPRHLLSRKLLLIAYIAECDALHHEFTSPPTGPSGSLLGLGLAGLRAGARLIRGRIEISVHGLV
jgi:hypothetical protein